MTASCVPPDTLSASRPRPGAHADQTGVTFALSRASRNCIPTSRTRCAAPTPAWGIRSPTEDQVVIAAEVMVASSDFGHLEPMLHAAAASSRRPASPPPEVVLADAGYWHHGRMHAITELPIPPDSSRRKGARPRWEGGAYAAMRERLATDRGAELYRKRQPMIEPVFGQMKFNRRGRHAARSEWRLITATHNLLKLYRHNLAPMPA